jgi:hypothetical protein
MGKRAVVAVGISIVWSWAFAVMQFLVGVAA